jgi:hypothetical protein
MSIKTMQLTFVSAPISTVPLAVVLVLVQKENDFDWEYPISLYGVFSFVGIGLILKSWLLRKIMVARPVPEADIPRHRFRAALVGAAMCNALAILGFVAGLLTGELGASLLMIGVSFVAMVVHFPRAAWLRGEM